MFVIARIILGFGSAISGVAAAVYLNETYASKHRAWGVGILNDFYYVGALIAAGVTLGTGTWESTWAWRAPSLFQGIFSGLCILILPFVPESPRWLVYQGYPEEARICIAQTNADGDLSDPVVLAVYKEILDTLKFEKERSLTTKQIVKDPVSRKRLLVGMSAGPFFLYCRKYYCILLPGSRTRHRGSHRLLGPAQSQRRSQRVVSRMCPPRNIFLRQLGQKTYGAAQLWLASYLPLHHWRFSQNLRRRSRWGFHQSGLW